MSALDKQALEKLLRELLVVMGHAKALKPKETAKQTANTKEELQKILRELLVVIGPVRRLQSKENMNPNTLVLPHVVQPEKPCLICSQNMANVVLFPCWHCVVCSDFWGKHYSISVSGTNASSTAKPNRRCPVVKCQKIVKNGFSLKRSIEGGDEHKVDYNYGKKNEYLGESAAEV